ncbi:MAG TPA: glutathione transferase GstA [Rickettsiales bacterium]|nr:glutathione transferase GstA [Rickettsiales bacterium]
MKLYYTPGVCSLSPHIILCEAGFPFTLEKVDLKTKKTSSGKDFNQINPKSVVPVLELDNGEILTEGPAIVQYLADLKPEANLAPQSGTMERVRLQEWLNFISTDMHKSHWAIFHVAEAGEQAKQAYIGKIKKNYDFVADKLKGKQYLLGDQFTVADAYLFTILTWHKAVVTDLLAWPVLVDYMKRVSARPHVQEALEAEGASAKAA